MRAFFELAAFVFGVSFAALLFAFGGGWIYDFASTDGFPFGTLAAALITAAGAYIGFQRGTLLAHQKSLERDLDRARRARRNLAAALMGEISSNVGAYVTSVADLDKMIQQGDIPYIPHVLYRFTKVYDAAAGKLGDLDQPELIEMVVKFYGTLETPEDRALHESAMEAAKSPAERVSFGSKGSRVVWTTSIDLGSRTVRALLNLTKIEPGADEPPTRSGQ